MEPRSESSTPAHTSHDTDAFWFLGTRMAVKAAAADTGGLFGLIDQSYAPPGFAAPPHVHHAEDEAFYILEGQITVHRGDEVFGAAAGAFVWLPRDIPHWFVVEGSTPSRILQWTCPGGLEQFFVEMGQPISGPPPPAGPPDVAKLLALSARYHVEVLGPPSH